MAGASVSIMKLDEELTKLLDAPCRTTAFTVAGDLPSRGKHTRRSVAAATQSTQVDRSQLKTEGPVTPAIFIQAMHAMADAIAEQRDWLSELDGVIGDGDHGITMDIGWSAVRESMAGVNDETITEISNRMAKAFLDAVGASTGPLYSSAFRQAGANVSDRLNLDSAGMVSWVEGLMQGILARGGAKPGDKTMSDAWIPAVENARQALEKGADILACLEAACKGAEAGRDHTSTLTSQRGRSKKLGERSVGHIDPGAASAHVMLLAMKNALYKSI